MKHRELAIARCGLSERIVASGPGYYETQYLPVEGSMRREANGDYRSVPQIWMTYSEIGELIGCDVDEARDQVVRRSLDRKRSRDGFTRAKLDAFWMAKFYATIRNADAALDQAIRDLQAVHT